KGQKFLCLLVSFPSFTPDQMCLSGSLRWHYMRSFRFNFIVYGFQLLGDFFGGVSLSLGNFCQI
ncbi:hypothetical protein ACS5WH_004495, partial [Vibrio parahaemolyticus]